MDRIILHVDMNNCYASIECQMHPEWRGLPLAVGGSEADRHGIILAKSQEAKAYGIKAGEAIWQARQKCPELLVVPPHYDAYLDYSRRARKLYYSYTNQVEPFGLDECWLDITGSAHLFGDGPAVADAIRARMKAELGISVSVGVSFNKIFAKLGSDYKKPDATTVIDRAHFKEIVWPLGVEEMIGIGPATTRKLHRVGIRTLGELAAADPRMLRYRLGVVGVGLWQAANGLDKAPVSDYDARAPIYTIGHGITCREDLLDEREVHRVFQSLAFRIGERLLEERMTADGVQITLKDSELVSRQFQRPLPARTSAPSILVETAMDLFRDSYVWTKPLRAVTIRAIGLERRPRYWQGALFENEVEQSERRDRVVLSLRRRFGERAMTYADLLRECKLPAERSDIVTLPHGALR